MIKKISISVVIIAFILGAVAVWFKTRPVDEPKEVLGEAIILNTQDTKPIKSFGEEVGGQSTMEIDSKKSYEAILKTSMGDITIALTASATPITVNNFVALS